MKKTTQLIISLFLLSGCSFNAPKPAQLTGKPRVKINQVMENPQSQAGETVSLKPTSPKRTIKYDEWTTRSVLERWAREEDLDLDWRSETDYVITDQDRKNVYSGTLVQAIRKLLVNHASNNNEILNVASDGQQILVGNLNVLDEAGVYQIYDADRSLKDVLFRWARLGNLKLQWKLDYDLPIPLAARLQTYETDLYKSVALLSMYYELVNKSLKVAVDDTAISVTENQSSKKN